MITLALQIFAVQNGHECWSGLKESDKSYNKYGESPKCKNNLGGPWANSVYRIEGASVYVIKCILLG